MALITFDEEKIREAGELLKWLKEVGYIQTRPQKKKVSKKAASTPT